MRCGRGRGVGGGREGATVVVTLKTANLSEGGSVESAGVLRGAPVHPRLLRDVHAGGKAVRVFFRCCCSLRQTRPVRYALLRFVFLISILLFVVCLRVARVLAAAPQVSMHETQKKKRLRCSDASQPQEHKEEKNKEQQARRCRRHVH